ncbi:phosphoribosylformylglycinamidine synthase subunit PurL [Archaeoglobus veneficus]|uniref:Phosphoribosylformylglycinamidine synthase subunit PurL n=1 Tax=Archaeoglobus veneficus (strain DSM 11195 / SNP6) TaxID=693661 RepID=F2KMI4_ARCVS|nr:phosphoribosylformylglycinamidine synthase subunit PurL [Archaeoglobus veneficus]AEA47181.1 Phosphoribosylformylglycinamidine synthase 2 [Archaeoglobus veneficus SNP6]
MLYRRVDVPFELYEINILDASDEELVKISEELGLALNLEEMKKIKEYFAKKGRNPYDIEIQSIAQAWSEHCCYKSSKCYLKQFLFDVDAEYVISAIKEDAGVVEFDEEHAYVVALESHNHPSAIEPYGGAATGIGGILRDVLCMGAQPVALVDPLFFGRPDTPDEVIPRGTKHPLYLLSGVVAGIRDYGNRVGIPTVGGMVFFDDAYLTNCLVNVGCIGIARKDRVIPSKAGGAGDLFVLAGGLTGRDGIHGVTFASAELDEKSEEEARGAVQLGNPIIKEPLIHACLEIVEKGLLTGMKDLGGGGLSCVVGEMSLAAGCGAEVWLEKVPLKEKGMAPWEIWISESQERMMLTVKPQHVDEVLYIFQKWDVPAVVVGRVTDDKILRIYYHGHKIYEMDIEFVVSAVEYCRPYTSKKVEAVDEVREADCEKTLLEMLSHYNVASREWIIRQYDHEVRASTVVKPLQGRPNMEGHGDAAVIRPTESWKGLALTADVNPWMTKIDPYWGTASAFDEMIRNLVAVNATPHSFADCLNFGNPEKPERMGEFVESVKALGWMARNFGLPCVSGNVSFYNETPHASVPPTPTLMGVGVVEDVRKAITVDFKRKGSGIVLVGETAREFGGSLYCAVTGMKSTVVPRTSPERLRKYCDAMLEAFDKFKVLSCHDVAEGGIAVAIAEMCIASGIGCSVSVDTVGVEPYVALFAESNTRWVVEVENPEEFVEFFRENGLKAYHLGYTGGDAFEVEGQFSIAVGELDRAWRNGLTKYTGW